MIHFVFTPMDRRYLFLKGDTPLDISILQNNLMDLLNKIDPICYLPTFKGIPFKQEFLWQYRQSSGDLIFYAPIGMWYPIWRYFKDNQLKKKLSYSKAHLMILGKHAITYRNSKKLKKILLNFSKEKYAVLISVY